MLYQWGMLEALPMQSSPDVKQLHGQPAQPEHRARLHQRDHHARGIPMHPTQGSCMPALGSLLPSRRARIATPKDGEGPSFLQDTALLKGLPVYMVYGLPNLQDACLSFMGMYTKQVLCQLAVPPPSGLKA